MLDRFNREISYLRISITDRCNLRCIYCMPEHGIRLMKHDDILSFEEIEQFVKLAVSYGINKIRLTGGEPLVRKNITQLVQTLANIRGVKDLAMTTNGILLDQYAYKLKDAGLKRVNISLDTIDPKQYSEITRNGNIEKVFRGIEAALKSGLHPVKINCVLLNQTYEKKLRLINFCEENQLELRFIHQMDLLKGEFSEVEGGEGGNCAICNRVRLMANGDLKPCLFSSDAYNIRELGYERALNLAVGNKPEAGTVNSNGAFYSIGG